MRFAKYKVFEGAVTKDGHTMFVQDIAKELNRKSFLESKLQSTSSTNIQSAPCEHNSVGSAVTKCVICQDCYQYVIMD